MFYLAALLPVCFIAGYTGAFMPTQWAVLSLTLPLTLWVPAPRLVLNWLGVAFFVWAFAGLLGAEGWYSAVLGLWYIFIWGLAYRWGSALSDLSPMWRGLAVGLSISAIVALAQHLGVAFPTTDATDFHGRNPGLLFNPVISGLASAIVLVGLATHRLWLYTPLPFLGLVLSGSRGGWLILALTASLRIVGAWITTALLVLTILALTTFAGDSDIQRLQIWGIAIHGLTFFGWGPDSFNDVYAVIPDAVGPHLNHLEFAHNDYLQLLFEYGIGAIPLFILWACVLIHRGAREHSAGIALAIAASFCFPLYHPLTAFILCTVAGHLAADWDIVWGERVRSRFLRLSRTRLAQRFASIDW